MEGAELIIHKVKKKLDSDTMDETKIVRYLNALDTITIGFDLLKSTGIGKTVNTLKKKGGGVADQARALIKKWKDLVPANESPKKNKSALNSVNSDCKPEQSPPRSHFDVYSKKSSKSSDKKSISQSDTGDNRDDNKKRKLASSMQLCDLSFVSDEPVSKKVKKLKQKNRPTLAQTFSVMPLVSLPSPDELGASLLPDIKPNYIPQRHPDFPDDESPKKKKVAASEVVSAKLLSSRKSKTQVFSGKRSGNRSGVVLSLYEMCIRILIENIEALYDTGGVPYDILQPVLAKCSPAQLWNLEDCNSYFIEDTGPLWKNHCHKDFKGTVPENHDDWRTLYIEKHEETEKKLKSINARINANQAAKTPVRQVKLAFIQTQAKAPPQIRRKQIRHGTGNGVVVPPPPRIKRSSSTSSSYTASSSSRSTTGVSPRKPKTTPMMKKVKQMGNIHRSRANSGIIRR